VREGLLYINGEPVKRQRIEDFVNQDNGGIASPQYIETLPGGVSHRVIETRGDQGDLDNTPIFVVPEGHYFMMGDNRDRSADSRVLRQVGYVPATNLIGKGEARFFSIKDNIPPWQLWQWPANVRWDRMFQSVYSPIDHTPT
jgi:signal peptidase I